MTNQKVKILAISGSLRSGSINRALLEAAGDVVSDEFDIEIYDGVESLPFFNEDLEGENLPDSAAVLDKAIRAADAVLISTPEYNGAIPGGLKNLLDWGSRPAGSSAFGGKPTAVIGASPGQFGAARSVGMTTSIVEAIGAVTIGRKFTLGGAFERFDSNGELTDEMARKSLEDILEGLASAVHNPVSVSQ